MKKTIFLSCFVGFLVASTLLAATPSWVKVRPQDPEYYIGIGVSPKKGSKAEYRQKAQNAALFDLASAISVTVTGTFMQEITELAGLTEEKAKAEIASSAQARLTGHELVETWEDRNECWAFYRVSKAKYNEQMTKDIQAAVTSAQTMIEKASRESEQGNTLAAAAANLQALAELRNFLGTPLKIEHGGKTYMVSDVRQSVQNLLNSIEFTAGTKTLYALAGQPPPPLEVRASIRAGDAVAPLPNLPVRFVAATEKKKLIEEPSQTDATGAARCHIGPVALEDNGCAINVELNLFALCPLPEPSSLFDALVKNMAAPKTVVVLKVLPPEKKEDFYWAREFEEKRILVVSAYESEGKASAWPKMQDEITTFLQGKGALKVKNPVNARTIVDWSTDESEAPVLQGTDLPEYIVVLAASGKVNRRKNEKNPSGEDHQFSGEIRTLLFKNGQPHFSDRYTGSGGWNPMGEQMCMEVMALHAAKRWKMKYLEHLGKSE